MKTKDTQLKRLYNAKIKATGKMVEVYRHHTGAFIDYLDCGTEYLADSIVILNEIKE